MWRLIAKIAISCLLIWLVLRGKDLRSLLESMLTVQWWALVVAIGLLWIFVALLTLRWSDILAAIGHRMPMRLLFTLALIGQFFNQTLPSAVGGDAVRIWLLHKSGVPGTAAVSSILLDRLLGILAILLLVTVGIPALMALPLEGAIVKGVIALVCLGYFGFVVTALLDRLPAVVHRFNLFRFIAQFSADLRAILLSPRALWRPLICSIAIQFGTVVVVFALAQGMDIQVTLLSCLIIVPLSNLLQAVPISIGGWGVRENFFVLAFQVVGVPEPRSLALSVLYGLLVTLAGLPGGVVWLVRRKSQT
jgi:glycosyltransferase 2 family protein